jgi:hypothetical protein
MITIDLPAGWFEPGPFDTGWDAVLVESGPDTQYDNSGWGVQFTTVGDVYRDPCDVSKGTIPASQVATPRELAVAIAAWPGFAATAASPVAVDGHSGLAFTLSRTAKGCGLGTSWRSASNGLVNAYPFASGRTYSTTMRIVDTGHGLLVIRAVDFPNTSPWELGLGVAQSATRHAADQPKLQAILDSIRLTDWPAST